MIMTPGDYLHRLPPPSWRPPAGKVLVHNHVYPVARRPGSRGSPHYRVRLPRG